MTDSGYEEYPARQEALSEKGIDPNSSLEWRISHGIAEQEHITDLTKDWHLFTQSLWDQAQKDSEIRSLLENALDNPIGPQGLRTFLQDADEVFQNIAKPSRKKGLTRISRKVLDFLDNLPDDLDKGKLKDAETFVRPDLNVINNASKDILLMSLGVNLQKNGIDNGFVVGPDGQRVEFTFFDQVPEELADPSNWNFRFNLYRFYLSLQLRIAV